VVDQLTTTTAEIWAPTLALVIARVAGMFAVAPVFAHPAVPVRLRVGMAVVVSLAVGASLAAPVAVPRSAAGLAIALASQAAIGAVIGYAARLLFVGLELGALHIGRQMGLGLADMFNPSGGGPTGSPAGLLRLLAVVMFLAIGGHRDLIASLLRSFRSIPLRGFAGPGAMLSLVVGLLDASFEVALKLAAPVLIAMLLATVAMAFLQKTMPQCNILSTNLPIRAMAGMLILACCLAVMMSVVESGWTRTAEQIGIFINSPAGR